MRIKLPGSWFGACQLSAEEKMEQYEVEAHDWAEARKFPKKGRIPAQTCAAINFICERCH